MFCYNHDPLILDHSTCAEVAEGLNFSKQFILSNLSSLSIKFAEIHLCQMVQNQHIFKKNFLIHEIIQ